MNWESLTQYTDLIADNAILAAIVVVLLIVLLMAVRLIGSKVSGRRGSRLGVSEFHEIDKSRRLVLVRRDNVEHLVMIGGNQDMVIESGIGAVADKAAIHRPAATPSIDVKPLSDVDEDNDRITTITARAPKPAVFGDRAPNLRPVERSEPKLDTAESGSGSS